MRPAAGLAKSTFTVRGLPILRKVGVMFGVTLEDCEARAVMLMKKYKHMKSTSLIIIVETKTKGSCLTV